MLPVKRRPNVKILYIALMGVVPVLKLIMIFGMELCAYQVSLDYFMYHLYHKVWPSTRRVCSNRTFEYNR